MCPPGAPDPAAGLLRRRGRSPQPAVTQLHDPRCAAGRPLCTTKEALAIAEQIDDTWGISHALQLLGTINRLIGERDVAIHYFERSLPAIRLIGDRLAEGVTLANLSILYNLKENYSASGHAAE